jgi:multidrug efflux pump subunit AcrA (membrane-fusion protein)
MKTDKTIRCGAALLTALVLALLLSGTALGESVSLEGTVVPASTVLVTAPIGGTVAEVCVEAGQAVRAGDVLCRLRTNGVYAQEAGTVTGIFAQEGDDAETVAGEYGAVLYLQGAVRYRLSASVDQAYESQETKEVRVGETVYLAGRTSTDRKGEGVIIAADGSSFTVEVTKGSFFPRDTVDVYRDSAFSYKLKLGRGTVSLVNPVAVTAAGAIVNIAVEDGQHVKRGQLLLETLDGSFDGLISTGDTIVAPWDGVVASVSAAAGGSLTKGAEVAVIWSEDTLRAEFLVPEADRNSLRVGDPVTIELVSAEDLKTYPGTVTFLSAVAAEGESSVCYRALAEFTPDGEETFGMKVLVNTQD